MTQIMIQLGNAPCSWGIIENIEGDRGAYARVLDEMAETGFAGTELGDWGFMPTDPAKLSAELEQRNLKMLASWVSVSLADEANHAQNEADAVRTARLLAAVGGQDNFIVLGDSPYAHPMRNEFTGRITEEHGLTDTQWDIFAKGANQIAKSVMDETGLRTVMHHHTGTWIETPAETERLMAMTDPAILGLVFDTGHWLFGGGDPISGLKQFEDRIWHVHFKDVDAELMAQSRAEGWDGPTGVGKGIFCELGKGMIDFTAVLQTLRDLNYDGWIVVEQDVLPGMGSPKESAARNRAYLRSIGL